MGQQIILDNKSLEMLDLSNYALTADLSNYATKTDLSKYALTTDLSSYVSKNFITSMPYCEVFYANGGDASFALSGADGQAIPFNNVIIDTHNAYSTSTGKYTCPVSGIYLAIFNFFSNTSGWNAMHRPTIFKNNAPITQHASMFSGCICETAICNTGDTLFVSGMYNNSSISFYGAHRHNSFKIMKLRDI